MISMRKARGFKLRFRVCRVFKWVLRPRRKQSCGYKQLLRSYSSSFTNPTNHTRNKAIKKICNWGKSLKEGAKELCSPRKSTTPTKKNDYIRLGGSANPFQEDQKPIPKGHLAVYVGDKDDDYRRVLVPVFYFNHPLFGELLREAEKEYGFEHPGGITIPCQISEFENVKTRIAAGEIYRNSMLKHRLC
ncbi:hypothetical protein MKW92_021846 [Papaver armeniacum]|nr:hypothetical protein MKW92_021846 [Papaver armeniacum]